MSAEASLPIIRTAKLSILSADQVESNWPVIESMLSKALPYALGRVSLDDVRQAVVDKLGTVVIGWDPGRGEVYVAFFCEIEEYKTGRRCWNVSLAGGRELHEWVHLWPVLKQIARDHDCDHIEISGRAGWGRALGLKEVSRTFIEDI